MDVILTVLAAWLITAMADWLERPVNFWYVLGGLFVTGIAMHRLFCVRTTVDRLLFRYREVPKLSPPPFSRSA